MKLYKSMQSDLKSAHGTIKWKIGEWQHQDGKIKACHNGFHASKNIIDAMRFVNCEILAEVEIRGKSDLSETDKVCYSDMRIVKAYKWNKEASVKLAIFAAEQVIEIYEKKYPQDKRPREAIKAAKNWLTNPSDKAAARAARAAEAAARAARAAEAAAEAAEAAAAAAAAEAAEAAAAEAAAEAARAAAAEAAAEAARAAEAAAAEAAALKKCHGYIIKEIIPSLKEIT